MTIKIPDMIGLPPSSYTTKDIIEYTMPTAKLNPCEPDFQKGQFSSNAPMTLKGSTIILIDIGQQ